MRLLSYSCRYFCIFYGIRRDSYDGGVDRVGVRSMFLLRIVIFYLKLLAIYHIG
jgi:hypothetical protein